jgi:hypothetical protein
MDPETHERQIRIRTEYEVIDGLIRTSPFLRTLDDLNVASRNFVTVYNAVLSSTEWSPEDGPLAVNRDSILFVMELSGPPILPSSRAALMGTDRHTRAAIRLRVGDYLVQGCVHVPHGGNALSRLYQASHPFVALTSVSATRQQADFTATFLAVNRAHILAAQEIRAASAHVARGQRPSR